MIPVFRPSHDEREVQAVRKVLLSGWTGLGPETKLLEEEFASYIGVKGAVALNSCTAALHLALILSGAKGRTVVTTPMTFVSGNHAILYAGGVPRFADVESDTLSIDPDSVVKRLRNGNAALVCVHYGGRACDMDRLHSVCRLCGVSLIEDVAHGCGGKYDGKMLGSLGDFGCFSFHSVKNLSCGDGGMLVSNNEEALERARRLRWCGIDKNTSQRNTSSYSWDYSVEEVGFKYHMNDISAAIARVQLSKLDEMNEKRRFIAEVYDNAFEGVNWITPLRILPKAQSSWHNYAIFVKERDDLLKWLAEAGISSGVHYRPNTDYSMYSSQRKDVPVANRAWKKVLLLPIFPDLTEEEQGSVIDTVLSFGERYGRA